MFQYFYIATVSVCCLFTVFPRYLCPSNQSLSASHPYTDDRLLVAMDYLGKEEGGYRPRSMLDDVQKRLLEEQYQEDPWPSR
jgi:hypothetical protein